jgi:excisionase family DNA binding protein
LIGVAPVRVLLGICLIAGALCIPGAAQAVANQEVLDLQEAAQMLRVAPGVVRQLAESHRIPARRIGDDWRFSHSALLDWLKGEEPEEKPRPMQKPANDQQQAETLARELWNMPPRAVTEPPRQPSEEHPGDEALVSPGPRSDPRQFETLTHELQEVTARGVTPEPPSPAQPKEVEPPPGGGDTNAASTTTNSATTVGERPTAPTTADIALRDQSVLLPRGAGTLEFGMAYGRTEQTLLPVIRVEQSDFGVSGTLRYGLVNDLQVTMRGPAAWHSTKTFVDASVTGANLPSTLTMPDSMAEDASVSVLGVGWRESVKRPTLIWSLDSTLPFGPGDRGMGGGLVVSKSYDPAVLFAGFTYLYGLRINPSDPNSSLAKHNYGFQTGYTYAVNDTLALSTAFFGTYRDTRSPDGIAIPPPRQNYALQLGTTWLVAPGWFVEPSVAMRVGSDTPGLSLLLNVSHSFVARGKH